MNVRGIWKLMPPWRYLVQITWPWSRTFPISLSLQIGLRILHFFYALLFFMVHLLNMVIINLKLALYAVQKNDGIWIALPCFHLENISFRMNNVNKIQVFIEIYIMPWTASTKDHCIISAVFCNCGLPDTHLSIEVQATDKQILPNSMLCFKNHSCWPKGVKSKYLCIKNLFWWILRHEMCLWPNQ